MRCWPPKGRFGTQSGYHLYLGSQLDLGTEAGGSVRITRVEIGNWRNVQGVSFDVFPDARLVCLVGENGSGKSTVLELLSFVAHYFGISAGLENPRGDPHGDSHDFKITALVPEDVRRQVNEACQDDAFPDPWQGLLQHSSHADEGGSNLTTDTLALGIADPTRAHTVGQTAINLLRTRPGTHHLYLDADRAYPPMQIAPHLYSEILSQNWTSADYTKQFSFRPTRTLYEEWHKYFIAVEERFAGAFVAATRDSKANGTDAPEFVDPFSDYGRAVQEVLPHLRFVGVEGSGTYRTIL
ncbi:AAA family ATPase, partial [Salmonella enterica]|nr:AAA family ATPase [Salmonella enterica]